MPVHQQNFRNQTPNWRNASGLERPPSLAHSASNLKEDETLKAYDTRDLEEDEQELNLVRDGNDWRNAKIHGQKIEVNWDESSEDETDEDREEFLDSLKNSRDFIRNSQFSLYSQEIPVEKSSRLDSLPEELKVYIATFMDVPSLGRISQLSKRWNVLASTQILWKTLCIRDFGVLNISKPDDWKSLYMEYSVPLEKNQQFLECCYGQVGEHQAASKLRGHDVGTFLFRSSSMGSTALTISYVAPNGQVRHRRMYRLHKGFSFKIPSYNTSQNDNNVYKCLRELLRHNSSWLKKPLIVQYQGEDYSTKSKIQIFCPRDSGPPSSAQVERICRVLSLNQTVAHELSIKANIYFNFSIGNEDVAKLLAALEENRTVTFLSFHHMALDQRLCNLCARLLENTQNLSRLCFFHCTFEAGVTTSIIEALKKWSFFSELILNKKVFRPDNAGQITESEFNNWNCSPWECQ